MLEKSGALRAEAARQSAYFREAMSKLGFKLAAPVTRSCR